MELDAADRSDEVASAVTELASSKISPVLSSVISPAA